MNDLLHKILKFVDHERGKVFSVIVTLVIVLSAYGCSPQLASPISGNNVTHEQFLIEVASSKARIEAVITKADNDMKELLANSKVTTDEFAKWEDMKGKLFNIGAGVVTTMASGGGVNVAQLAASVLGVGGLGMAAGGWYDSGRKNKVIEKAKVT